MARIKDIARQLVRVIIISTAASILLLQTREGFQQQHVYESLDEHVIRLKQLMKEYETRIQAHAHAQREVSTLQTVHSNAVRSLRITSVPPNATLKINSSTGVGDSINSKNTGNYTLIRDFSGNSPDHSIIMDNWVSVVDPHDYGYLINPRNKCDVSPHLPRQILLVICVLTAPQNFERRNVIRKTYGNESVWPLSREGASMVRVAFMIGATKDNVLQRKIETESALHGDIVQENFIDSYWNLTRKTVMALKWATTFCENAIFMMKADDDIILNVEKVTHFLLLSPPDDFTAGMKGKHVRVMRSKTSKYYTPRHVYNFSHYEPYYMGGSGYFLSLDVADRILDTARRLPLFPWEDIFVSFCMRDLGIPLTRTRHFAWGRYTVSNGRLINDTQCQRFKDQYLVAKGLPANHMLKMWVYTHGT